MKKGFTLIELLVVITIIGILSAIVLTSLDGMRQRKCEGGGECPKELEVGQIIKS